MLDIFVVDIQENHKKNAMTFNKPAENYFNIHFLFLKSSSDFDSVSIDSRLYSETRKLDCDFYHRGDFRWLSNWNLKRGFLVIADIGILQTTAQFCLGFEMQRWRGSSFTFSCTLCCLRVSLFFDCFLIGFSFEFRQFIKTIRICFLVKCWQCSIWPGLVCQVQMWSMIENYDCAWNSYLYEFDFACA